jgi:hypothetical protein
MTGAPLSAAYGFELTVVGVCAIGCSMLSAQERRRWRVKVACGRGKDQPGSNRANDGNGTRLDPEARNGTGMDRDLLFATGATMFFFFSSRLGCLGSILLSALLTLLVLLLFGVI